MGGDLEKGDTRPPATFGVRKERDGNLSGAPSRRDKKWETGPLGENRSPDRLFKDKNNGALAKGGHRHGQNAAVSKQREWPLLPDGE